MRVAVTCKDWLPPLHARHCGSVAATPRPTQPKHLLSSIIIHSDPPHSPTPPFARCLLHTNSSPQLTFSIWQLYHEYRLYLKKLLYTEKLYRHCWIPTSSSSDQSRYSAWSSTWICGAIQTFPPPSLYSTTTAPHLPTKLFFLSVFKIVFHYFVQRSTIPRCGFCLSFPRPSCEQYFPAIHRIELKPNSTAPLRNDGREWQTAPSPAGIKRSFNDPGISGED